MTRRACRTLAAALLGLALLAPEARAASVVLSGPTTSVISGIGLETVFGAGELTFIFSLDVPSDVQGYALIVSWDPAELELVDSEELVSGGLLGFTRAPDPLEPGGTRVVTVFAAPVSGAQDLFSLTFRVLVPQFDGLPDVSWVPEDEGLSPPALILDNPGGAGIDVSPPACLAADDPDQDDVCTSDGDNCPFEPNPDQADSGGVGSGAPDGTGDVCQCGDVTGGGIVGVADAVLVRRALAGLGPGLSRPELCNSIGPANLADANLDGLPDDCIANDAATIRRSLAGRAPGIAQVCAPAVP